MVADYYSLLLRLSLYYTDEKRCQNVAWDFFLHFNVWENKNFYYFWHRKIV